MTIQDRYRDPLWHAKEPQVDGKFVELGADHEQPNRSRIGGLDILCGMSPRVPAEVRAAAIAARREGVGVVEVARRLNVSHNAVSKWSREAGIEAPAHRPCGVCVHPQRDEIDTALIANSVEAVRREFGDGFKFTMLDRHRRLHLGMPVGRGYGAYPACKVCDHPDRDVIDQALRDGESRTALAHKYEPDFTLHILRNHLNTHLDNPRRDAAIAAAAEVRRQAAAKVAERSGPPPGFFLCPECDSENVRCKGSGNWREDPGPIYWHVTDCLDCGWPDDGFAATRG
jgi:transposase-like protein